MVIALAALAGLAWPLEAPGERIYSVSPCPAPGAINPATGSYYPPTARCPGSAPTTSESAPSEPPYATPGGGGKKHGGSALPYVVGAAGLAALFAAAASSKSGKSAPAPMPRMPTPDELLRDGPVTFPVNPIGTFAAYGFVQNGAPIVVDVRAEPGAKTQLTVMLGDRTSSMTIDPGGEPLVVTYQGGGAAEPQVAMFKLTSTRPGEKGNEKPAPITVVGIGAGQRAMGSVAINRLSFGPPQLQVGAGQAALGYVTESPFDRLATDVLRYRPGSKKNTIVVERVWRRVYSQLGARAYAGQPWDGRPDKSNAASTGVHLLQVTGWELSGDLAWVAAYSPGTVEVK